MELLVRLQQDKNPKIGIVYPSEFQAGKAFEQIQDQYPGEVFTALLELGRQQLVLTLRPLGGGRNHIYKHVFFRAEQIRKLQQHVQAESEMELIHVYKKGNEPFVAKVRHRNPLPLRLQGYEILSNGF